MNLLRSRGGIFISYRREDTAANAGRLYDRLSDRFGEDQVFMDIDSIPIGLDFTKAVIEQAFRSPCDVRAERGAGRRRALVRLLRSAVM
jgi:hypothetical protein